VPGSKVRTAFGEINDDDAQVKMRNGVVPSSGTSGLEEVLRPVPARAIGFGCDMLTLATSQDAFESIKPFKSNDGAGSIFLRTGY
jgi:hypothetical protein